MSLLARRILEALFAYGSSVFQNPLRSNQNLSIVVHFLNTYALLTRTYQKKLPSATEKNLPSIIEKILPSKSQKKVPSKVKKICPSELRKKMLAIYIL